ncbi:hypothetical protein OG884_16695 [Streptosporangium sp. NBC_01755]|uniref:hypothetical protein n=1 Tax=unclassified Streptosporangium TaxID=2632669 RepID=UPI002DD84983|nr:MULTISPECIES: hypothetical protein [unclassified Streptosporangium]WSA25202.1 hypothetical protein OIE13_30420 [Streptosporangium sp. NBC_01810]WSD03458.1 hypothetical protein OG884_16695 [Streptosporangium sp. NBC_01755]
MRIRMLAAAVVTAGALMATLTGAASADDTPTPAPKEGTEHIQCDGGGHVTLTTHRLTEAEIKELEKAGSLPFVSTAPSGRADEAGVPAAHVTIAGEAGVPAAHVTIVRSVPAEAGDAKELPPLPEGVTPGKDIKVMAAPTVTAGTAGPGAPEAGMVTVFSEDVPEGAEGGEGAGDAAVRVMSALSGDEPKVTCFKKE